MAEIPGGEAFPRPFGKYTLLREAGRGGKGIVYEAMDTVLQRRVALKVSIRGQKTAPEEFTAEEERFLLEARIGAFLPKHQNIVSVYEAGVIDERRYLATEYIDGEPMTRWRRSPNVSVGHQVRLLRDVALAMEHAHGRGVIHRDLKPSNILVDRNSQPHVTDFGLAKMVGQKVDTAKSFSGKLLGTPAYMSPEHARGQEVGHRTDVYSLGVMLYEILTGHTPFRGPTSTDVLGKVVRDVVVAPSKVLKAGTLTPRQLELEPICMKALSKDPEGRHASARAFAEDLSKWLDYGKTVRAEEKKSKGLLIGGIAAAAFLALVLGIVLATRKKGPTPEELAARQAEQAEAEKRHKGQLEEEKKRADDAIARARRESEEKSRQEKEQMEARRKAMEEENLRAQALLDAQRREAEERARKALEQLNQPKPPENPPPTGPAAGTQPPNPGTANPPGPGTGTPPGPGKTPDPGPAAGAKLLPAAPPTGEPKALEGGALHWEAEDFSGEDKPVPEKDYHDTTPKNTGAAWRPDCDVDIAATQDQTVVFIQYAAPGEWLHYRFKGGGRYEVEVKYQGRRPGTVHFEVDGINVTGPIRLPPATDRGAWVSALGSTQNIPEGDHELRLVFDSVFHGLDFFRFKKVAVLPPPEAAQVREAEKALREVFKAEYAKRAPADQLALARKLLQEGKKTENDPVSRFVLFSEARDVAAQAGDVATALAAVDEMDKKYFIDAPAMKLVALNAAARTVRTPEASKALADAFTAFAEAAAAQDDFDQALALLSRAETAAKGAQSLPLLAKIRARSKEMTLLRDELRPLKGAFKTLETKPDDPAANLAAGQYRCFVRDDWIRGLPMLAKGADPVLAALARKELEGAEAPEQEVALGDAWKDAGEKKPAPLKNRCFSRALFWYEKAAAELTGLERLKVENQVEALYKALGSEALKKGLVFWVEPARDQGEGYRELAFLAKCNNVGVTTLMDAGVKALNTARGFVEYTASEGVRSIERQGSVFAWIKAESYADVNGCVVSRGEAGLDLDDFSLWVYDGKVKAQFNHGDARTRSGALYSKGSLPPAKWVLAGITWEETGLAFYIDGKKDSEAALPAPLNPPRRYSKVVLGKNVTVDYHFIGLVGAVLFYNRELSEDEVKQLYVGSRSKFR